jgi:hypothetical protein
MIRSNNLTPQLSEMEDNSGANNGLSTKLKRKNWRSEKLCHIPGDLEGHAHGKSCVHAYGCTHGQEKLEKTSSSHA